MSSTQYDLIHLNDTEYIKCCKFCSSPFIAKYPKLSYCMDCRAGDIHHNKTNKKIQYEDLVYISQHPKEYYEQLSLEKFNTKNKWHELLVDIEVSKLSTFSQDTYNLYLTKQSERNEKILNNKQATQQPIQQTNIPRCPICQSINIVRISTLKRAAHGFTFGLFSKTARSEWECKNCGSKF